jgi:hypothetical protein
MNAHTSQYAGKCVPAGTWTVAAPSGLVEYGLYCYIAYTLIGGVFGLWISNAASAFLLVLVIFCVWEVGSQIIPVVRTVAFPLGCGIAYAFIQLVLHEESLTAVVRPFLIWMLMLVLVQSLVLRTNFLHRFVLVMFLIGLAALPYVSMTGGNIERATLDSAIGFSQINLMGEWYGFCALYFAVLAFATKST